MSELSLNEWKAFLTARIAQEQGDDEKALKTFEELLRIHPDNVHLQSSVSFALERLGRGKEAAGTRIAAKYAQLASSLSGGNDQPDAWNAALSSVVADIDHAELRGSVSPVLMVW